MHQKLKFRQLPAPYAIVRFSAGAAIPDWVAKSDFTSITRTAEELSIVCRADIVPKNFDSGPRWLCLKLEGLFPLSQTRVLLSFIEPLSNSRIPIFAISTYDTDYVLVPEEFAEAAIAALQRAAHEPIS